MSFQTIDDIITYYKTPIKERKQMWIDLQENALLQMKDVGLAKEISRFATLEKAKSFYNTQEGKYAGYVNPSSTTALATPVVVLQLQKGRR